VAAGGDHDRAARLAGAAEALTGQITNQDRRAEALAQLAAVIAADGDHDRAEALTGQITDPHRRAEALAQLAGVAAAGGDHDRAARLADEAEALTGQITDPHRRAEALAQLAGVAAAGGDHDRAARLAGEAEALTGQITDPDQRAEALAQLAKILVEKDKETSPVPGHARSSSPLMVRARHLLGAALVTGSWIQIVASLARVEPLAVTALADEVRARWC
jgi:lipopolysaccharide biosynthesis regulator YciM